MKEKQAPVPPDAFVDLLPVRKDAETDSTVICAQCESNARWNEAGGYRELAEKCREYCRRGHRERYL